MNTPHRTRSRAAAATSARAPLARLVRLGGWLGCALLGLGAAIWSGGGRLGPPVALAGSLLVIVAWLREVRANEPGESPGDAGDTGPEADVRREVAEHRAEAEGAVERSEAILYAISHDVRSPLGATLNYATILEEDYAERLDAEGAGMLGRIRSSASRAMDLIDGLLELSRLGRKELSFEDLSMDRLAREAAAEVVDDDARCVLSPLPEARGDRELVRRVWRELLRNAARHTAGTEQPTITISGRVEGTATVFEVADNGEGFDMRFEEKLFRPLEQLHPREPETRSIGIGLALVAEILRRHGGTVTAKGATGEGASFRFSLPREPAVAR